MKKNLIAVTSILILVTGQVFGALFFDDGKIHNVDYYTTGSVNIDWRPTTNITTVNLLAGGSMNNGNFLTWKNSQLNINGGVVNSGNLVSYDNSQIEMSDGKVISCNFGARNSSCIIMSGGTIVSGNFVGHDNAIIDISGGLVDGSVVAANNSTLNLSGGRIGYGLVAADNSHLAWTGGKVGLLTVSRAATVEIYGSNFAIDGVPVQGSILRLNELLSESDYFESRLTGTLSNGDIISTTFYAYTVPEPCTIVLLYLGGVLLRLKK